jgi:hypothetical protein
MKGGREGSRSLPSCQGVREGRNGYPGDFYKIRPANTPESQLEKLESRC